MRPKKSKFKEVATPKEDRQDRATRLLAALKSAGIPDTEIAFKIGAAIQSIWRWQKGRAPTPLYFAALEKFATEKGIK
jgi:hypothetical protein